MRALQVGDVVALDAQRRVVELKRVLDLLQRLGPRGEVARAAELVQREGLRGVAGDGLGQGLLVAALRHAQVHRPAAALGEPLGHRLGVRRQLGDEDLARDAVAVRPCVVSSRALAVELAEERLDEGRRRGLLDLLHHPAALAPDPAAAHVEDLHGGLKLVFRQRDHVAVGAVAEDHRLLLQGALQGLDVVPQPGGALVLLLVGGLLHVGGQLPDEAARLAGHEVAEVLGERPVLFLGDPLDAGGGALADVAEQARAADLPGALEHAGGAGADREDAQQRVDRLPDRPRVRVRAEVPRALPLGAAHHHDPRVVLPHRHREVGVGLVVAVLDVEPRVELLDPGVLQLERLDLGVDDRPLDARGRGDHQLGARVQRGEVGEVLVEPLPQRLRLPDVDDPAALVAEPVHARLLGDLPGLGAVTVGVGHGNKTSRRRGPAGREETRYSERARAFASRRGPAPAGGPPPGNC